MVGPLSRLVAGRNGGVRKLTNDRMDESASGFIDFHQVQDQGALQPSVGKLGFVLEENILRKIGSVIETKLFKRCRLDVGST